MDLVDNFINKFDATMLEEHKVPIMNVTLQETSVRWWGFHCNNLMEWDEISITFRVIFRHYRVLQPFMWYMGKSLVTLEIF